MLLFPLCYWRRAVDELLHSTFWGLVLSAPAVCSVLAILLTVVSRVLLNRYVEIVWPVLVYPSLTAVCALALWLNAWLHRTISMETIINTRPRQLLGRWVSIAIVTAAVILGLAVLYQANYYPRTEDAEVFANFIGIAPQVDGPLVRLNVKDNQFVKKGELLYEIDKRPYDMLSKPHFLSRPLWKGKFRMSDGRSRLW